MFLPVVAITILTFLCSKSVLLCFNQRRICLLLRPKVILDCVSLVFSDICLLSLLLVINSPDRKKLKKASLKAALILMLLTCVKEV
jgi:hypothetical protein